MWIEIALPLPHTSCLLPIQSFTGSVHHFRHSLGVKEPLPSLKSISKFWKLVSLSVKGPHYSTHRIYRFFFLKKRRLLPEHPQISTKEKKLSGGILNRVKN